jgi:hypothetical protein
MTISLAFAAGFVAFPALMIYGAQLESWLGRHGINI